METVEIDLNHVVDTLTTQVASLSKDNAYNVAIIQSKDLRIKELEKELEELRKEQIAEMDGESDE